MHRLRPAFCVAALLSLGTTPLNAGDTAAEKKAGVAAKTVVVLRLKSSLQEAPIEDPFDFGGTKAVSLKDLVAKLKKAEKDANIKALVLLHESGTIGSAQLEELRQAMASFQAAGKEIYSHSDSMTMREYALLSGANRLSVVPTGDLWITGLFGEAPYLRGLLDKIGVKPDFLTCGSYKSASEVFMREGPSPEAEKMQNWLLDSLYDSQVSLIAAGRHVPAAKVKAWIDGGPYSAEKAKAAGLIDAVEQRQDFEANLKKKLGNDVVFEKKYGDKKAVQIDFNNPFAMFQIWADLLGQGKKARTGKKAVGIVYVDGAITIGGGPQSPFGESGAQSTSLRRTLNQVADDDSIKAVVLRINSPGGSAVASDIILDATKRVKAKKPFVVSMGDVAGSGGYYVACGADTIFADRSTITGSIGVVAGKLATNDMFKKIGITFKAYQRGANAGMLSSATVFTKAERERMQNYMDEVYEVFKGHVTAIRGKKLTKPIDEIAGGRVYTGEQALKLGLVDKIGSLEDAIKLLTDQAKLAEYDVRVVPQPKNFIEKLMEEISGEKEEGRGLHASLPAPGKLPTSLLDLALPYLQQVDPHRLTAVKQALQRLELIRQEGAVLMMPEFVIRH